ncbi:MAG: hypothetical protein V4532_15670 [Pseudomonadota bacterium]
MTGQKPRSTSLLKRTRYWSIFICLTALMAGGLTLWAGHAIHGVLMLLAALVLAKGSVFRRRQKTVIAEGDGAMALSSNQGKNSPLRRAA